MKKERPSEGRKKQEKEEDDGGEGGTMVLTVGTEERGRLDDG